MRRIMLSIAVAAVALLVTATNIGCEDDVITTNARSSLSGFLTGVFSQAISNSL